MDYIFWYIVAGVLLAVIIASCIVVISNHRHRQRQKAEGVQGAGTGQAEQVSGQTGGVAQGGAPEVGPPGAPSGPGVVVTEEAEAAPRIEAPEAPTTRMARLRKRLASSNNALARGLAELLSSDKISDETWEDFEATLLSSDLGIGPTTELVTALRSRLAIEGVSDPERAKAILRQELITLVDPTMDRTLDLDTDQPPAVILVVGVNGTGKTTTVGKLARDLVASGKTVLLGAADTFRAAAADQLSTWGDRIGVETVRGPEGADPASVAFDAVRTGKEKGVDVVLVDTAGRLHNKTNLMDELGKVKRVIEKTVPVKETLLVLDATTGQNGLVQARVFAEVADVTGIVLTKLDGSAKGGIVVAVQKELKVPVKFIGLGEGADDLAQFDAEQFVDGLLGQ